MLPINISQNLNAIFSMVAVFAGMVIGSRWLLLIIIPLIVIYLLAQTYYRKTAIELQRLEAISRAPLISHIGETLSKMI